MAGKQLPKKVIEQVKEYKKILRADKLPVKDFYVFGSYAKGRQHKWSDIDVCVVSSKFKNPWTALTYLRRKVPNTLEWLIEPLGFSPKDFDDKYSSLISLPLPPKVDVGRVREGGQIFQPPPSPLPSHQGRGIILLL